MKAKFVYESVNFERGKDPKSVMGIGDGPARYEAKMKPWLDQVFRMARIAGFKDDREDHLKAWDYPIDGSEEDGEIEYLIGSSVKKIGLFKPRIARVHLVRRDLTSYWYEEGDVNDHHNDAAKEFGSYYVMLSDPAHPVDKPGMGWTNLEADDRLQKWATIKPWIDLARNRRSVYENISFERGQDPRDSMKVGHAGIWPYKTLFEEIHEYCETNKFPGWKEVSPIEWDWKEPTFKAIAKTDEGLRYRKDKTYNFYLMEDNSGVGLDVSFTDKDGNPDENYYTISSWKFWIRILESLHPQFIPANESINFERGRDPKDSMEIGRNRNNDILKYQTTKFKDNVKEAYKLRWNGWELDLEALDLISKELKVPEKSILAIDPYSLGKAERDELWYKANIIKTLIGPVFVKASISDRGLIFITEKHDNFALWILGVDYKLAESINFERGRDPREAMDIGVKSDPFVIEIMEQEVDDDGPITGPLPEDHDQNTWFEPCDDYEVQQILNNWKEWVDGSYYFYGHYKQDGPDDTEHNHAAEFNDEWVEYKGQLYYIPDHREYWDKFY